MVLSFAYSAGFWGSSSTSLLMHNFNCSQQIPAKFVLHTFIYLTASSKPSMSAKKCFYTSGPQNRQSCVESVNLRKCPELGTPPPPKKKILLCEPCEQSCSVLGYPSDFGLQTWNAKSTMPEVCIQFYCAIP